ncbi:MAG TPA: NADH-quinone oxidoreductase subunit C [Chitinophagaceae bacterium]|nr:NADH-quinone oxidoreductase subunit C [Chitinophagaceae bacterium]
MNKDTLITRLRELLPAATPEGSGEWAVLPLPGGEWHAWAGRLRDDAVLQLDYLFCLTCVDWKTRLTMVYHLGSSRHNEALVIKIDLDREQPSVPSVSDIWRTAEFHEREVYELFGVDFPGHPDLRLLILPEGWEGKNPLRKDFEDPVNMIKL